MEWKKEFNFLLYIVALTLANIFTGILEYSLLKEIFMLLVLIFGLYIFREYLPEEKSNIYNAAVLSLFIVISAILLREVLKILNISTIYAKYVEGFGFLISAILLIAYALYNCFKRLI